MHTPASARAMQLHMHRNSTEPATVRRPGNFELVPQVGSFYEVAPDVGGLRQLMVNVFFIGEPGSSDWTLVDAGLYGSAEPIMREAARRFGPNARPRNILLTHGHFDHVGALKTLARTWGVDVFAHSLEMPYLTGRSSYPPPDPTVGGGAMAWSASLYPKRPIDARPFVKPLPNDGSVPGLAEWRWLHTPGHAPGHVSFFRERDRALIAGDAFVTTRQESLSSVINQTPELNGPPAYFTPDWDSARDSVKHLAALNPEVVATGHGVPMRGERMRQELHVLADNFDLIARPAHGRYVNEPALAGINGVTSVPPPTPLQTALLAGAAVLVVAGVAGLAMRDRE
jgi:glyoxylase-like metal-dependent hydrolase (beta-lactamase superfamily II)